MSSVMTCTVRAFFSALVLAASAVSADIYKVVDKDGNVIFTDQPPGDGSEPMDLPPLSVIETTRPAATSAAQEDAGPAADAVNAEPTPAQLRKMYRDFGIIQPQDEETFWGTANTVFISWGGSVPPTDDMSVRLYIDGQDQAAPAAGGLDLVMDRGEHQVYVELRDARNRLIVTSKTVTFYVKQHSVRMNSPVPTPGRGG